MRKGHDQGRGVWDRVCDILEGNGSGEKWMVQWEGVGESRERRE